MNAVVKAPTLTSVSVLALVRAAGKNGTTLVWIAEDLDVPASSVSLKLTVAGLIGEGRIRWVRRAGRDVLAVTR